MTAVWQPVSPAFALCALFLTLTPCPGDAVRRIIPPDDCTAVSARAPGDEMSKGLNQKKEQKKKPAKTMKEKKAEKREKSETKRFGPA